MRGLSMVVPVLAALPGLAAEPGGFGAVRQVLESRCLECHTGETAKGGLVMETRDSLLKGGENGASLLPGNPEHSPLWLRCNLPADDDDRMPPKKTSGPLSGTERETIFRWIGDGAPWEDGQKLAPVAKTAMPRWDAPPDPAISAIEVFPEAVTLETSADFHRVLIRARMKDAATRDVTAQAKLTLEDPSLARLDGTTLLPLKNGSTVLRIGYRGLEARLPVVVKDAEKPRPISFQLDVMPVLTASGCNTGACHGSARGQDGFRLSLFGFDPKGDHFRLTREMAGRRVNTAQPEESLLLTKALGTVPHTGGARIRPNSASHKVLLDWIRGGAGYDADGIPVPVGIEVRPKEMVMNGPDLREPLTVRALYSDGTDRDVTPLSIFSTSNDNSVSIKALGSPAISSHPGEAFLLARFHTFTEGSQAIVVPDQSAYVRPNLPENNFIDKLVHEKLNKLRILPSEPAGDEEFLRRVYLDVIGLAPTPEEREAFLADKRPDKRAACVDRLLERKEFADMWVMKWAELLQIRTFNNGPQQVSYKAALNYYQWLRERIAGNRPLNEWVAEILSAKGGTFSSPATNYFQIEQDPLKLAENTAQVFMGTRIQCAQCHNHPFDRWTMDDYYGFAAFFAQVKRKPAEDPRERIVFDEGGETQHPVTKQTVPPKFLGGIRPELKNQSRREALATWLAAPENPWFARNAANIVWAHFFGVGIVEPVDDMRVSNPPSNPELLNALANHLASSHFDLRSLVREICNSRIYQLSTRTNPGNTNDNRNFSHALVRRIRAEVLLDCISQATRTPNKFKGLPLGSRAVQIADGNTGNYFLTTFGRASRATVCSCEVKMEPNLSQALHLLNGDTTQQRIRQGKMVEELLKNGKPPSEVIRTLYLATLCREPLDQEMEKLLSSLPAAKDPAKTREALEDVFWALLNSKEFIFNH